MPSRSTTVLACLAALTIGTVWWAMRPAEPQADAAEPALAGSPAAAQTVSSRSLFAPVKLPGARLLTYCRQS